jgi:SOS-response transcriptional repressor LexA
MNEISPTQQKVFDFITSEIERRGIPPTLIEIQKAGFVTTPAGARDVLTGLEKKGYIKTIFGVSRGIQIIKKTASQDPVSV